MEGPNCTEINLIDNYAETARADFLVVEEDGTPADKALVDFKIYNYAEFYPALSKYTDSEGRTFLTAGKGETIFAPLTVYSDTAERITVFPREAKYE